MLDVVHGDLAVVDVVSLATLACIQTNHVMVRTYRIGRAAATVLAVMLDHAVDLLLEDARRKLLVTHLLAEEADGLRAGNGACRAHDLMAARILSIRQQARLTQNEEEGRNDLPACCLG